MDIITIFLILFILLVLILMVYGFTLQSKHTGELESRSDDKEVIHSSDCNIFIDDRLYVGKSTLNGAGYGVFTKRAIPKDTIIEIAHTIPVPIEEREYLTTLLNYDFSTPNDKETLIAMGFGGMYNNQTDYNIDWHVDNYTVVYTANRDVRAGEELFINYGPGYFQMRDMHEQ